jgi:acetyl-CoA carboxylase biotin carboxyl carrier protein
MPGKNIPKEEAQGLGSLKSIREILDLMNEQGISEFELENNGFRVRIKRGATPQAGSTASEAAAQTPHFGIVHPVPPVSQPAPGAEARTVETPLQETSPGAHYEGLHVIKSPIVGTFYATPTPDAVPFVKVGDVVQPGQVLCIIEAMKLMNEIEAEVAGEITRIYVENGQPVEYGQALFGLTLSQAR